MLGLDTNILLRWSHANDKDHRIVRDSLLYLSEQGLELYVPPQNLAEFWNVCTRPVANNGFNFSIERAQDEIARIEAQFLVIEEKRAAYFEWKRLSVEKRVVGVQVHDALRAALYLVHGFSHLLTFNARDFGRYGITPISLSGSTGQQLKHYD